MIVRISKSLLFFALLLSASQWNCSSSKGEHDAETATQLPSNELIVKVVPASREEWIASVPISGTLRTLSTVEVKPEVGGRLISVHYEEGSLVRQGQLIAEIDPVNYKLTYDQAAAALTVAEAGLERAQVAAEHARTEKERADNLLRSGGITQKDHQAASTGIREAETQVRLAEAQCAQARAALAIAEKALKDCKIYAPADGHVQKKFFNRGSLVAAGISLCSLVDNSRLELECVVPSYQLAAIRIGQRAAFTTPTWGERQFDGVVSAIIPEIEADSRSATLKLKIANPGGELRSGMYARGEITTGREKNVLIIPRDALIPEKEQSTAAGVFVVRDGKAHRLNVTIAGTQEQRLWVKEGLNDGELVISEIGPSLKEGVAVKVAK